LRLIEPSSSKQQMLSMIPREFAFLDFPPECGAAEAELAGRFEEGVDPSVEIDGEDAVRHALQDGAAGETFVTAPAG
jgi:hypothetical protein